MSSEHALRSCHNVEIHRYVNEFTHCSSSHAHVMLQNALFTSCWLSSQQHHSSSPHIPYLSSTIYPPLTFIIWKVAFTNNTTPNPKFTTLLVKLMRSSQLVTLRIHLQKLRIILRIPRTQSLGPSLLLPIIIRPNPQVLNLRPCKLHT